MRCDSSLSFPTKRRATSLALQPKIVVDTWKQLVLAFAVASSLAFTSYEKRHAHIQSLTTIRWIFWACAYDQTLCLASPFFSNYIHV